MAEATALGVTLYNTQRPIRLMVAFAFRRSSDVYVQEEHVIIKKVDVRFSVGAEKGVTSREQESVRQPKAIGDGNDIYAHSFYFTNAVQEELEHGGGSSGVSYGGGGDVTNVPSRKSFSK